MKSLEQIFLGIDEHSFHGRDYVLVITEIKERKPLAVLSDNKIETLKKWLKSLPNEVKDKIT
jgi:transposase